MINEVEKIGQNVKKMGGGGSKEPSVNYESALSICIFTSFKRWNLIMKR